MTERAPGRAQSRSQRLLPQSLSQKNIDRIEESTRLVSRALRHALNQGRLSVEQAAEIAVIQLLRPGGPSKRLPAEKRGALAQAVRTLSRVLDLTQPRSILAFSRGASEAAWALITARRHPGTNIEDALDNGPRALARAAIYAEASQAKDSEDHIRRAVTRALRERKKKRGLMRLPLEENDPLRTVLDVAARGRIVLPPSDVRAKIALAAAGTPFGEALRLAARFSEEVVRPAIGDELWSLARPVGFADKGQTKVLVEVRSNMAAHEVQLRSQELLHRLRKLPGFTDVQSLKILVIEARTLRVR